jgi:outer membrane protein assembly factor BamB
VAWKVPLPGPGNSTPIVVGERVFLTQAENQGRLRSMLCLRLDNGRRLWKNSVEFTGEEPTHDGNPACSASPVSDGERVVAWHGSAGVVAYDLEGTELWRRDLGPFTHIWGNAASPVLLGDRVIVSAGPGLRHDLVALDKRTGAVLWRVDLADARAEKADQFKGSWCSPVIVRVGTSEQIVLGLPGRLCGFDPATGRRVWWCEGLGDLVYASPLAGNGTLVAFSGYGGPALGMRLPGADEAGDLTATHRLWRHEKATQRVGSGVIVGEHAYILNESGLAQCIHTRTGELVWGKGHRVGTGQSWSSLVVADGKLWGCTMKGETVILRASPEFELVGAPSLGEMTRASLAVSGGRLLVRTYRNLFGLEAGPATAAPSR